MKKLIALLLSLSCLFSLAACGVDKGETFGAEGTSEDWGITLTAQNVTSTGMTLICTQSGGIAAGSLETGADYTLEVSTDGKIWSAVEPLSEPVWDMMSRLIPREESVEWEINWEWLYGELGAGQYRICKTITLYGESGALKSQFYCAEFEIT